MDIPQRVHDLIDHVQAQKESALILGTSVSISALENVVPNDFVKTELPLEAMSLLEQGSSVYMVLNSPLSKDTYDFIVQYGDRAGMIQIMDKKTMEYRTVQFNPYEAHLLLLAEVADIKNIEEGGMAIRDKVGLVEQV